MKFSSIYPQIGFSAKEKEVLGASVVDEHLYQYLYPSAPTNHFRKSGLELWVKNHKDLLPHKNSQGLKHKLSSDEVNDYLNWESAHDFKTPLWGILAYQHPEYWYGDSLEIMSLSRYELQRHFFHMGVYLGLGRTVDAPSDWAAKEYKRIIPVDGRPATLYGLKLRKLQEEGFENSRWVNLNLHLTTLLIHRSKGGIVFPDSSYKSDPLHVVNLRELFLFYRAVLDEEYVREDILEDEEKIAWEELVASGNQNNPSLRKPFTYFYKIRNDKRWLSHCSEFVHNVTQLGLNLIQNEQGYREIYGEVIGKKLWEIARREFAQQFGKEIPSIPNHAFSELWRVDENSNLSESRGVLSGILLEKHSLSWAPNTAFAWNTQSSFELLESFFDLYLNWAHFSFETVASSYLAMSFPVYWRTGMPSTKYYQLTQELLSPLFKVQALYLDSVFLDFSNWENYVENIFLEFRKQSLKKLSVILRIAGLSAEQIEKESDLLERSIENLRIKFLTKEYFQSFTQDQLSLIRDGITSPFERVELLTKRYKAETVQAWRMANKFSLGKVAQKMLNREIVENNFPPSGIHRILHEKQHRLHPRIEIKVVGTVMDAAELEFHKKEPGDFISKQGELVSQKDPREGLADQSRRIREEWLK